MTVQPPSVTIRQLEFELEKAEHGLAMPYDAERVGQLRKMLVEARKRKLSAGLKARREQGRRWTPLTISLTKVQARMAAIVGRAFRRPASLPPCHDSIPARTA